MSKRSLFVSPSSRPSGPALLAATLVFLGAVPSVAGPLCRPALAVKEVRFTDIQQAQRVWTARLDVDASRCAAKSGRFEVEFTRVKETGLDATFSEAFSWRPGEIEVSTVLSEDEAVGDYAIAYVAPCGCR